MNKLLIFDVDGVLEKEERMVKARHSAYIKAIMNRFKVSKKEAEKRYSEAKNKLPPKKKYTSAYKFMKCGFTRKEYFRLLDKVDPEGIVSGHKNCIPMLKKLEKKNKIITYSNASRKATNKTLKVLKIDKLIDKAYSVEDFKESKPSTKNLKKMMKDMGFKAKDTIFIGNSLKKDILPAKQLGIKTILFDPYGEYKNPKEADFVIKDLIEVVRLV